MWVNGFTHTHRVHAHFDGEADFRNQITCARADDIAPDDATCFFVKNEFGEAFVAAVGSCAV